MKIQRGRNRYVCKSIIHSISIELSNKYQLEKEGVKEREARFVRAGRVQGLLTGFCLPKLIRKVTCKILV